jgi:hypothetical protein
MRMLTTSLLGMSSLVLFAMAVLACDRSGASSVVIEAGEVKHVNGCNVTVDVILVNPKAPEPAAAFRFVCDVPESVAKEKQWWGDKSQPLMNTMEVGDCMRFKKLLYCVEKIDTSDATVTLKATYNTIDSDVTLFERIK